MSPKLRRATGEEVQRRWSCLNLEQKQNLMSWDDPSLVERIKTSLQALFEKQMWMNTLGIKLDAASDPFAASTLFTTAFEFTWQIARSAKSPHVVLIDPACMPVMAMKSSFLEGDQVFRELGRILPDLLSERSGRSPMPKARWKDLWAAEPSSVAAMELQLVKLVEQALWAMGSDPALECPDAISSWEERPSVDSVPLEPWMMTDSEVKAAKGGDLKKKRHKLKKQRAPAHAAAALASEAAEAPAELEEKGEEEDACATSAQPSSAAQEEQAAAWNDESTGHGVLHLMTDDASTWEASCEPTAASTPSAHAMDFRGRSPATPPLPSLLPHQAMLHPKQLVCYIWNQTSQFESSLAFQRSSPSTAVPSSSGDTQAATPFTRGQWTDPCGSGTGTPLVQPSPSLVLSAVVRKTFLDIDDPNERLPETTRTTRSLSPAPARDFTAL